MIPFFNVREQYLDNQSVIDYHMQYAMSTGQMYSGDYLDSLKYQISADYEVSISQITLTNSGTSALTIAINTLNIPRNSSVLMPTLTYVATAQAVIAAGLRPVFVDIDENCLMCFDDLKRKFDLLRPFVKAVIGVDLYGQPIFRGKLEAFCTNNNLKLVIDSAQSYGSKHAGTQNRVKVDRQCLSFNPLKNWGGIGGGAVIASEDSQFDLHAASHEGKAYGEVWRHGLNMRMDSLQAGVLLAKYDYYKEHINRKGEIHLAYRRAFPEDIMPYASSMWTWNPYVSVIFPKNAEEVRAALDAAGIEHRSHYTLPLHMEPYFKDHPRDCPRAEALAGKIISLPNHWHLRDDQVHQIIDVVSRSIS